MIRLLAARAPYLFAILGDLTVYSSRNDPVVGNSGSFANPYRVPTSTGAAVATSAHCSDGLVLQQDPVQRTRARTVQVGWFFNKIQCFCFEEQRLRPRESIDMPIFFYIDPEFATDRRLRNVDHITLSYCFFRTGELPKNDDGSELAAGESMPAHLLPSAQRSLTPAPTLPAPAPTPAQAR